MPRAPPVTTTTRSFREIAAPRSIAVLPIFVVPNFYVCRHRFGGFTARRVAHRRQAGTAALIDDNSSAEIASVRQFVVLATMPSNDAIFAWGTRGWVVPSAG